MNKPKLNLISGSQETLSMRFFVCICTINIFVNFTKYVARAITLITAWAVVRRIISLLAPLTAAQRQAAHQIDT